MGEFFLNHPVEVIADGQPQVDEPGPVNPAGMGAESLFNPGDSFHPPGIFFNKSGQRYLCGDHHFPDGICEIVGTPPEFICVVEAVRDQPPFGGVDRHPVLKRLVVLNGLADIADFVRAKGIRRQNLPGKTSPRGGMIRLHPPNVVEQPRALDHPNAVSQVRLGKPGPPALDADQCAGIQAHLDGMVEAMAEIILKFIHDPSSEVPDHRVKIETVFGKGVGFRMVDVKIRGGIPGDDLAGVPADVQVCPSDIFRRAQWRLSSKTDGGDDGPTAPEKVR